MRNTNQKVEHVEMEMFEIDLSGLFEIQFLSYRDTR